MWAESVPQEEEELRQGDVLASLLLPQVKMPLTVARPSGADPKPNDLTMVPLMKVKHYVVTSQCCTIDNHKSSPVLLAPVSMTEAPLEAADLERYANVDPSTGEVVFNHHLLDSLPGVLDEPGGRKRVIDLRLMLAVGGDRAELRGARVAAMTPAGRRLLRLRLMGFFGRTEPEDKAWFDENGLADGLPAPSPDEALAPEATIAAPEAISASASTGTPADPAPPDPASSGS